MSARPDQLFCIDDVRFDRHIPPAAHPERPARLTAIREGLVNTLHHGGAELVAPRDVSDAELLRVHSAEHLEQLERALSEGSGQLEADTYFSPGTRTAVRLAAGGAVDLAERLVRATSAAGVLAARPPGHHATRVQPMGFCLINNVAVAAAAALEAGLERVAIVDWDVHHGNGTQAIFEADPRVLFVSMHQWPLYPGTGKSEEIGRDAARGHSINLPLPAGSRGIEYEAAFRTLVLPAIEQFEPELVLVSCGFDAHADDPLGGMALRDEDYGAMTQALWQSANRVGCHKLGLVLEGGYDLGALERAGHSVAQALLGKSTQLDRGFVQASAQRAIDATRRAHSEFWEL